MERPGHRGTFKAVFAGEDAGSASATHRPVCCLVLQRGSTLSPGLGRQTPIHFMKMSVPVTVRAPPMRVAI
jgi:hypothetical protein